MSDIYKLQYDGMTLTYPGWNGYVSYEVQPFKTLTLLNSEGGTLTANTLTGYPGDTISLSTAYNKYWRFSGYQLTGDGSLVGNDYTFGTEDATICACYKPNAFTATGGWEKGSDVNAVAKGQYYEGDAAIPDKYAIHGGHTGDIPASWYSNSNRWNVNSEVSSYSITMNPIMGITAARSNGTSNTNSMYTAYAYIGSTSTAGAAQNNLPMGLTKYNKTFTTDITGVYYKINGHLHTWTRNYGVLSTAGYVASYTTGTWTATGYAP